MAKKKEKLVCAECGGSNITYSTMAVFDANTHKFYGTIFEINECRDIEYFCDDCGEHVEFVTESEYLNTK